MSFQRLSPLLLVCCCMTIYFGYHAMNGRHGLEARSRLQARAVMLERELHALGVVRSRLEREVALLSPSKSDPDFVEELAREMLAYAYPSDRILLEPRLPIAAAGDATRLERRSSQLSR